jgi:hypothetical protein
MAINVNGFGNKLTGLGLNYSITEIKSFQDCFKDIDNLVLDNVQKQVFEKIMEYPEAKAVAKAVDDFGKMSAAVEDIGNEVTRLKEKSLSDLLKEASQKGVLDRIPIIAEIQDKFAGAVEDLNSLVSNITSYNPCNMSDFRIDANGIAKPMPTPGKLINEPPAPFPTFTPPVTVNHAAQEATLDYRQAMSRMGDVVNDKSNVTKTQSGMSMMASLQFVSRDFHDSLAGIRTQATLPYAEPRSEDPVEALQQAADIEIKKNSATWSPEDKAEFETRIFQLKALAEKDGSLIQKHFKIRKSEEGPESSVGENFFNIPDNILTPTSSRKSSLGTGPVMLAAPSVGSLVATGITLYGGPDWNYLRFLSIAPSQRPQTLIDYWVDERNKNIDGDIDRLSNQLGVKLGTRDYDSLFTGTYNKPLNSGYSISSTKFKGGTVLQLKNKNGTIYDPAGINPKGLVTVVDAVEGIKDFSLINLYITAEHIDTYSKTPLQGVEVYLYSNGVETSLVYDKAQAKWG